MVVKTIQGRVWVSNQDTFVDFQARLQVPVEPELLGLMPTLEGQAQVEGESERAQVALQNQLSMVEIVSADWKPLGSTQTSVPLTSQLDD